MHLRRTACKYKKKILGRKASYILINRPVVNIDDRFDLDIAEFFLKKKKIYRNLNKKRE